MPRDELCGRVQAAVRRSVVLLVWGCLWRPIRYRWRDVHVSQVHVFVGGDDWARLLLLCRATSGAVGVSTRHLGSS